MHFCACPIYCRVHWRVGKRLGSCRLISVQPFYWVDWDDQGILYKLCSVGIGGSVLSILTQLLLNRSQHVMVDGCRSKLVNVVSWVPHGSVLCPLLFILYTSVLFSILENKLIGYADDSTLMAVVPSPGVRVTVAESLIRDLGRVREWCDLWWMKLNESKTKTTRVSRFRTMHPQSPSLTIGVTALKEYDDHVILGVTFDSKMTFENHLRSVSRSTSRRLGISRKSWWVFHDRSLLGRCFRVLCPFWSTVLQCDARLSIHTLTYWTEQSVVPVSWLGVCLSVALLIVDL